MNRTRALAAGLLFLAFPAVGCEEPVACDKCEKHSEFSWNPSNQFTTARLHRFYEMEELIEAAYKDKKHEEVKALVAEYLGLAKVYRCNWNYGNAVYDSHRILGLELLEAGDLDGAAAALLEAGKSTGSPQLNTFGPELDLANELLKRGKTVEVVTHLNDIKTFWEMDNGAVDQWLEQISRGEVPELNRFKAREPGPLQIAAFYLALAAPLLISLGGLWAQFHRISRKVPFLAITLPLAYVGSFLAGWLGGYVSSTVFEHAWLSRDYIMHWIVGMTAVCSFVVPLGIVVASLKVFTRRVQVESS